MWRRLLVMLGVILIIASTAGLLYPTAIQKIYDDETSHLKEEYLDTFRRFDKEDMVSADSPYADYFNQLGDNTELLYQLMREYNDKLFDGKQENLEDPFDYESVDFSLKPFGLPDELVAFVIVPKLNVEMPVYLGASAENLEKGAAHLTGTSLPIGGINTNAVIAAHRGSHLAMLREIQEMEEGDQITVINFHEILTYQVERMEIIYPSQTEKIRIQEGRDMVTLITCHPYRSTRQRYVVYCERV